jgi:DNA-3-methyladenine glycosylase I
MKKRCQWPSRIELDYHDTEWGVPVNDDKKWFEYLVLDTFQAGLSWKIILQKRDGFRKAFYNFDAHKVAQMSDEHLARLQKDPSIIRNRLKLKASVTNAQAFIKFSKNSAVSTPIFGNLQMVRLSIIILKVFQKFPLQLPFQTK